MERPQEQIDPDPQTATPVKGNGTGNFPADYQYKLKENRLAKARFESPRRGKTHEIQEEKTKEILRESRKKGF